MSDARDEMLAALHDMRAAARILRDSRAAYTQATVDYAAAQERFEKASQLTPVKPVLTADLPVIPIADVAARAIQELG
jgi:hypothetical protein